MESKSKEISSFRKKFRKRKEDFYHWLVYLSLSSEDSKKNKVIFYPHLPKSRHVLGRIFRIMRYEITSDLNELKNAQFIVNWEDTTFRSSYPELNKISMMSDVINIDCRDISKKHVDFVFGKMFGYTTMVNPGTFKGKCVKKGDINAIHDGTIVECPVAKPDPGYIYQKLINNQIDDQFIEDIRVPVFMGNIPFVYIKNRPVSSRFASMNTKVMMKEVSEIFSEEEVLKIRSFCREMGLDYGELDILRDRDDNKIYIVDVNNTPGGPPNSLSVYDQLVAMRRLVMAFKENFINVREFMHEEIPTSKAS